MIFQKSLQVSTAGRGCLELSSDIQNVVADAQLGQGLCNVFVHHTSASLIICENADPDVLIDLETFMRDTVPDGYPGFAHTAEGVDDMPAHVRSVLTQASLTIPVVDSRCALGTWQGVYLWEHRLAPHLRQVTVTVTG